MSRQRLADLQLAIMHVLWDRGEATVSEVKKAFEPERHTGLMIDDDTHRIDGLAGQQVFYRTVRKGKPTKKHHRRKEERESAVWGQLIDQVGVPPKGVAWIHVCDRGADDIEVMWKAVSNQCGFVIRAARLNRTIMTLDGQPISLAEFLAACEDHGQREIAVPANGARPARTATVTLHYANIDLPLPKVVTPWLKTNLPTRPMLRVGVVELREVNPPKGCEPIRSVLYSQTPVNNKREADSVIGRYEQRLLVEDYHKALKTGSAVQERRLQTADRLERITALDSIVAVRLLQMKTAARETPATGRGSGGVFGGRGATRQRHPCSTREDRACLTTPTCQPLWGSFSSTLTAHRSFRSAWMGTLSGSRRSSLPSFTA